MKKKLGRVGYATSRQRRTAVSVPSNAISAIAFELFYSNEHIYRRICRISYNFVTEGFEDDALRVLNGTRKRRTRDCG